MTRSEDLLNRYENAFMPTYGVPPVTLVAGQGTTVWDADGNAYLDFIAGIAVSSLGHAHERLAEAVSNQVLSIAHTSNLFVNEQEVLLAEELRRLLGGGGRGVLANRGTQGNAGAPELAIQD